MNITQQILLEIAVENPVPVSEALYRIDGTELETFALLFNRKPLGISLAECADLIWELYGQNRIAFDRYQRYPWRLRETALEITRDELLAALCVDDDVSRRTHSDRIYYRLTTFGGETWELLASADWDCFLDYQEYVPANAQERSHVRLKALSKNILEEWYRRDADIIGIAVPESRRERVLANWQATYWKRFPYGYQIDYDLRSESERQIIPQAATDRYTPLWYNSPQ